MSFNSDPTKQAQDIVSSRKTTKSNHPTLFFNNFTVLQNSVQNNLGTCLDLRLTFDDHIKEVIKKLKKQ